MSMYAHLLRTRTVATLAMIFFCATTITMCSPPSAGSDTPDVQPASMPQRQEEEPEDERAEGYRPYVDEHVTTPPDALANALAHLRAMPRMRTADQTTAGRATPDAWQWLGPKVVAGRISAIVVHPTQPATMWLSSPSGGIWKTTDAGATWQPLDDFLPSLNVSALVLNPQNPNELYASTGDRDALGAGIFRSLDAGATWQQLPATIPSNTQSQWAHISSLAIAPDGKTLLAATIISWGDRTNAGLWRSIDGGANWVYVLPTDGVVQVVFHPTDGRLAVASSYGRAWYSNDGGLSWQAAAGLPTSSDAFDRYELRAELAFAPSNPQIVYASVDRNQGELWKSVNGGQSYTLVNSGTRYTRYGDQAGLWVNPIDPKMVVVGGVNAWRSSDGGVTLVAITDWTNPASVHADHRFIVQHPGFDNNANRSVYFGTDGGLYRADNIATVSALAGWTRLNTNLGITQFFDACLDPSTQKVMGGTLDNGTQLFTGTPDDWMQAAGGDGKACAIDPTNADLLYGQVQWMNIWRRDLRQDQYDQNINGSYTYWNGSAWVTTWKPAPYRIDDAIPDAQGNHINTGFFVPLVLDPNAPNRLLTAGRSVWRTDDARAALTPTTGPAWQSIKAPIKQRDADEADYWMLVSAVAVMPGNPNIIWVGYNDGRLSMTTNGTASQPTWIDLNTATANMPKYREITQILLSPTDPNAILVTFNGYATDEIWRTTDSGQSWAVIDGIGRASVPAVPIRTIAQHPTQPERLYVGTDVGLFTSQNGGKTWCAPENGPATVPIYKLLWIDTSLVAATFGRGIYRTTVDAAVFQCSANLYAAYLPNLTR